MRCEGVGAWGAVSLPGGQKEAGDIKKKMGKMAGMAQAPLSMSIWLS